MLRFAFYGRVSTEDQQDPESSRTWQLERSRQLIEPCGGRIVAEYFDRGHSRALPWQRRAEASELLAMLRHPDRGFEAVVIGEPQRACSPTSPRAPKASPKPYLLRGRLTCGLCRRRLQGQWVRGEAYYRCRYPAEYAASAQLDHPTNVYLREADLLAKLDGWLNELTSPTNIEATCRALAAAHTHPDPTADAQLQDAQQVLADCQRKLARYRAALEAGGDPALVNQWIAEITQQRHDAERRLRELRGTGPRDLDPAQVRALLEEIGDLAAAVEVADPAQRAQLYQELGINGLYQPASRRVIITADPGVRRRSVRVGGPIRPTSPRRYCGASWI